ncbi:hypothetical protein GGS20DRAFT_590540 [Poronia punctata]|nr:hypothetical protein GGS20DRAFT_590540 [Poronia punctata]
MERPTTPDTSSSVPLPNSGRPDSQSSVESVSPTHLTNSGSTSEPSPADDLLEGSLFLFPKPLGNRQLTNWISSSSPDIMQRENTIDDDLSLAELGYDIIGTDGESQAESTTSSFDYQKPDDIHSLGGTDPNTDVDSESSEDEDIDVDDTATSNATVVGNVSHEDDATYFEHIEDTKDDRDGTSEALERVNQSLESPTSLTFANFSPFTSVSYLDGLPDRASKMMQEDFAAGGRPSIVEHDATRDLLLAAETKKPEPRSSNPSRARGLAGMVGRYLPGKRFSLAFLCSLVIYMITLVGKTWQDSSTPGTLSTVPVASVLFVPPSSTGHKTNVISAPTLAASPTPHSLQAASSSNGHMFIPFGKEKSRDDVGIVLPSTSVFSAELTGRDKISIKIPQNIKAPLIAKNAMLIAVSRGPVDISTKVSVRDEGLLIQVPLKEAHGVVDVRIVTKRRPRINESFRIDFGTHRFTEALDAGKQLVREFAQRVVDTVNETTWWVEETYIPTLDGVSKQVCGQTASVSGTLLQGVRDAGDVVLGTPLRFFAQLQQALDSEKMLQRVGQVQLELVRQTRDIGDQLRMVVLKSQIQSKLLWLKMQGKTEEYRRYMTMAEKHWNEQRARVDLARVERAEQTKKQIWAFQKARSSTSKFPPWRMGRAPA